MGVAKDILCKQMRPGPRRQVQLLQHEVCVDEEVNVSHTHVGKTVVTINKFWFVLLELVRHVSNDNKTKV